MRYGLFIVCAIAGILLLSCGEHDSTNPTGSGIAMAPVDSLRIEMLSLSSVRLSWVHDGLTAHYRIDRKLNDSSWQESYILLENTERAFTDSGFDYGDVLEYRVYAADYRNASDYAQISIAITLPHPHNLQIEQISVCSCELTWEYTSLCPTVGFRIDRRTNSGDWNWLVDVTSDTFVYLDECLETGADYSYRVYAFSYYYTGNITEAGITLNDESSNMIFVPAGSFVMGDTRGDIEDNALPVHEVSLDAFNIGIHEVTHREVIDVFNWAYRQGLVTCTETAVMNAQGDCRVLLNLEDSSCSIDWNGDRLAFSGSYYAESHRCPCTEIAWYGAVAYCNYLSIHQGLTPCYDLSNWSCDWDAGGYRLPTEAEWEYAARGSTNDPDYQYAGSDSIDAVGWYRSNSDTGSGFKPQPVCRKQANNIGIHDMSGNVSEWCWDWYDDYRDVAQINPKGPESSPLSWRVLRGGCWIGNASSCSVFSRGHRVPGSSSDINGFRLARIAE